jgi:hypothetical protein
MSIRSRSVRFTSSFPTALAERSTLPDASLALRPRRSWGSRSCPRTGPAQPDRSAPTSWSDRTRGNAILAAPHPNEPEAVRNPNEPSAVSGNQFRWLVECEYLLRRPKAAQLERAERSQRFGAVPAPNGDTQDLLFVGQLKEYKGITELLAAWSGVQVAGARLRIVASGGDAGADDWAPIEARTGRNLH